jgi:hypothetical protein
MLSLKSSKTPSGTSTLSQARSARDVNGPGHIIGSHGPARMGHSRDMNAHGNAPSGRRRAHEMATPS